MSDDDWAESVDAALGRVRARLVALGPLVSHPRVLSLRLYRQCDDVREARRGRGRCDAASQLEWAAVEAVRQAIGAAKGQEVGA